MHSSKLPSDTIRRPSLFASPRRVIGSLMNSSTRTQEPQQQTEEPPTHDDLQSEPAFLSNLAKQQFFVANKKLSKDIEQTTFLSDSLSNKEKPSPQMKWRQLLLPEKTRANSNQSDYSADSPQHNFGRSYQLLSRNQTRAEQNQRKRDLYKQQHSLEVKQLLTQNLGSHYISSRTSATKNHSLDHFFQYTCNEKIQTVPLKPTINKIMKKIGLQQSRSKLEQLFRDTLYERSSVPSSARSNKRESEMNSPLLSRTSDNSKSSSPSSASLRRSGSNTNLKVPSKLSQSQQAQQQQQQQQQSQPQQQQQLLSPVLKPINNGARTNHKKDKSYELNSNPLQNKNVFEMNQRTYKFKTDMEFRLQLRRKSCCCTRCGANTKYENKMQNIVNPILVRELKLNSHAAKVVNFLNKMGEGMLVALPPSLADPLSAIDESEIRPRAGSSFNKVNVSLRVLPPTSSEPFEDSVDAINGARLRLANISTAVAAVASQVSPDKIRSRSKKSLTIRIINDSSHNNNNNNHNFHDSPNGSFSSAQNLQIGSGTASLGTNEAGMNYETKKKGSQQFLETIPDVPRSSQRIPSMTPRRNSFMNFVENKIKDAKDKKRKQDDEARYVGKTRLSVLFKLLGKGKQNSVFEKDKSEQRVHKLLQSSSSFSHVNTVGVSPRLIRNTFRCRGDSTSKESRLSYQQQSPQRFSQSTNSGSISAIKMVSTIPAMTTTAATGTSSSSSNRTQPKTLPLNQLSNSMSSPLRLLPAANDKEKQTPLLLMNKVMNTPQSHRSKNATTSRMSQIEGNQSARSCYANNSQNACRDSRSNSERKSMESPRKVVSMSQQSSNKFTPYLKQIFANNRCMSKSPDFALNSTTGSSSNSNNFRITYSMNTAQQIFTQSPLASSLQSQALQQKLSPVSLDMRALPRPFLCQQHQSQQPQQQQQQQQQ